MTRIEAKRVIEALRKGIPVPDGFVRAFTVGRKEEIAELAGMLSGPGGKACLLNADYGSGKTQMLRFLREDALEKGYAVALVACDCRSGIRFNRMDQVFGAVCKNLEFPGGDRKGILPFFQIVHDNCEGTPFWTEVSSNGLWSRSEVLQSPAMYVAFRAYRQESTHTLLEAWLQSPQTYKNDRKPLYSTLVAGFRDPRSDRTFYLDGVFQFDVQSYDQSWKALTDLDRLAKESGMKGLVLLFDEFEDILTNMRNIQHEETAMVNLFNFNEGKKFPGHSFFAVTPEFVHKCRSRLQAKRRCYFEFERFRDIKKFEMSPLDNEHIIELLENKIIPAHGRANGWKPQIHNIAYFVERAPVGCDRIRRIVTTAIRQLDAFLDKQE